MDSSRCFTLHDGNKIPGIGFGTWQAKPHEVEKAVEIALRAGYKHIDCAAIYRNEHEVGLGIKNSEVDRRSLFITSKLWNTCHRPEEVEPALDRSLKQLGVDYLDLYLMHWPVPFRAGEDWFPLTQDGVFDLDSQVQVIETWNAMIKLLSTGKVKSIGVSNFNIRRLQTLLSQTDSVPVVNQIEAHPYLQQAELRKFCDQHQILIEAYSPLGNNQTGEPRTVDDAKVQEIAERLGKDGGQVLVSWGLQRGHVVLPKSVTASRIQSNMQAFEIPAREMAELDDLERHKRMNFPAHWGFDIFDEAGQDSVKQAAEKWAVNNRAVKV